MRKVKLFIAMSVDGYIADKNGGVGFLKGHEDSLETEDTYSKFIKNIDIVLMGWNTYNQIITELSPDNWVYDN
ncbi:dihydrofolate reductase, partial [Aerococcaceae bacterium NML201209]|nr:dihydrofolate reductase [Aerococcaceae bacterium NML201209]